MSLLDRLRRRPAPTTLAPRSQICPPQTWGQAEPVWKGLRQWLTGRSPARDPLPATRADFLAALHDMAGRGAQDLRVRAEHARSMRELWHLRAELYNLIARQLSQAEAERRLAPVNRHFASAAVAPTRSPMPARRTRETTF